LSKQQFTTTNGDMFLGPISVSQHEHTFYLFKLRFISKHAMQMQAVHTN